MTEGTATAPGDTECRALDTTRARVSKKVLVCLIILRDSTPQVKVRSVPYSGSRSQAVRHESGKTVLMKPKSCSLLSSFISLLNRVLEPVSSVMNGGVVSCITQSLTHLFICRLRAVSDQAGVCFTKPLRSPAAQILESKDHL